MRRRTLRAERPLEHAAHDAAAWLARHGTRKLASRAGRDEISAALDVLGRATEALLRLRKLRDDAPHAIGFDVGGEVLDGPACEDDASHEQGLDVDYEHEHEPPVASNRRRGR